MARSARLVPWQSWHWQPLLLSTVSACSKFLICRPNVHSINCSLPLGTKKLMGTNKEGAVGGREWTVECRSDRAGERASVWGQSVSGQGGRSSPPPSGRACLPWPPAQSGWHISLRLRDTVCWGAAGSRNLMLTISSASCGSQATFRSKQVSGRHRWMARTHGRTDEADGPLHVQSYVFPT